MLVGVLIVNSGFKKTGIEQKKLYDLKLITYCSLQMTNTLHSHISKQFFTTMNNKGQIPTQNISSVLLIAI